MKDNDEFIAFREFNTKLSNLEVVIDNLKNNKKINDTIFNIQELKEIMIKNAKNIDLCRYISITDFLLNYLDNYSEVDSYSKIRTLICVCISKILIHVTDLVLYFEYLEKKELSYDILVEIIKNIFIESNFIIINNNIDTYKRMVVLILTNFVESSEYDEANIQALTCFFDSLTDDMGAIFLPVGFQSIIYSNEFYSSVINKYKLGRDQRLIKLLIYCYSVIKTSFTCDSDFQTYSSSLIMSFLQHCISNNIHSSDDNYFFSLLLSRFVRYLTKKVNFVSDFVNCIFIYSSQVLLNGLSYENMNLITNIVHFWEFLHHNFPLNLKYYIEELLNIFIPKIFCLVSENHYILSNDEITCVISYFYRDFHDYINKLMIPFFVNVSNYDTPQSSLFIKIISCLIRSGDVFHFLPKDMIDNCMLYIVNNIDCSPMVECQLINFIGSMFSMLSYFDHKLIQSLSTYLFTKSFHSNSCTFFYNYLLIILKYKERLIFDDNTIYLIEHFKIKDSFAVKNIVIYGRVLAAMSTSLDVIQVLRYQKEIQENNIYYLINIYRGFFSEMRNRCDTSIIDYILNFVDKCNTNDECDQAIIVSSNKLWTIVIQRYEDIYYDKQSNQLTYLSIPIRIVVQTSSISHKNIRLLENSSLSIKERYGVFNSYIKMIKHVLRVRLPWQACLYYNDMSYKNITQSPLILIKIFGFQYISEYPELSLTCLDLLLNLVQEHYNMINDFSDEIVLFLKHFLDFFNKDIRIKAWQCMREIVGTMPASQTFNEILLSSLNYLITMNFQVFDDCYAEVIHYFLKKDLEFIKCFCHFLEQHNINADHIYETLKHAVDQPFLKFKEILKNILIMVQNVIQN